MGKIIPGMNQSKCPVRRRHWQVSGCVCDLLQILSFNTCPALKDTRMLSMCLFAGDRSVSVQTRLWRENMH